MAIDGRDPVRVTGAFGLWLAGRGHAATRLGRAMMRCAGREESGGGNAGCCPRNRGPG
jgi:hypothetical protein